MSIDRDQVELAMIRSYWGQSASRENLSKEQISQAISAYSTSVPFPKVNGLTAESAEQRERATPGAVPKLRFWIHLGDRVQEVNHQVMLQGDTINVTAFPTEKQLSAAPTPPAGVPDERHPVGGLDYGWAGEYNRGWNECRSAMLSAAPQPAAQPEDIPAIFKEQAS